MGQDEVFAWLVKERSCGNEAFFSMRQIRQGLRSSGVSTAGLKNVSDAVIRLQWYGFLDNRWSGSVWNGEWSYRAKARYVRNERSVRRRDENAIGRSTKTMIRPKVSISSVPKQRKSTRD